MKLTPEKKTHLPWSNSCTVLGIQSRCRWPEHPPTINECLLVSDAGMLSRDKLTLLRNAPILDRSAIVHLSAINIELVIYHTCLMLMTSAKVLNRILLCSHDSYICKERKQSHGRIRERVGEYPTTLRGLWTIDLLFTADHVALIWKSNGAQIRSRHGIRVPPYNAQPLSQRAKSGDPPVLTHKNWSILISFAGGADARLRMSCPAWKELGAARLKKPPRRLP